MPSLRLAGPSFNLTVAWLVRTTQKGAGSIFFRLRYEDPRRILAVFKLQARYKQPEQISGAG